MLDLAAITAESLTPYVGQTFDAVFTDGRLPLTLAEVQPLGAAHPNATRNPFRLAFHGTPELRLPQGIYRLEHPTLGALEIFLVQIRGDASTAKFEAIFT